MAKSRTLSTDSAEIAAKTKNVKTKQVVEETNLGEKLTPDDSDKAAVKNKDAKDQLASSDIVVEVVQETVVEPKADEPSISAPAAPAKKEVKAKAPAKPKEVTQPSPAKATIPQPSTESQKIRQTTSPYSF
jgi:hypothetical protein